MNVSILLGEDFQTTYELSVTRYASGHCDVAVGRSGRIISTASSHNIDLGFEIRVAYPTQSFIRRKAVAHAKKKDSVTKLMEVVTLDDTLIQLYSVCNVAVHAAFEGCEDWIVEKVIIGTEDQNIMAAPTTWINSSCPFIPVANPGPHPRYLRAGEVVGYLQDPEIIADKPKDEEHFNKMIASTEALRTMITGTLKAQDLATATNPTADSPGHDDRFEENEPWGPKTTAVPEDPVSGDVDKLVNLRPDIPEDYCE